MYHFFPHYFSPKSGWRYKSWCGPLPRRDWLCQGRVVRSWIRWTTGKEWWSGGWDKVCVGVKSRRPAELLGELALIMLSRVLRALVHGHYKVHGNLLTSLFSELLTEETELLLRKGACGSLKKNLLHLQNMSPANSSEDILEDMLKIEASLGLWKVKEQRKPLTACHGK